MNLNINNMTENELKLAETLSKTIDKTDKYMVLLFIAFGFTLTKSELAEIIKKAEITLERRIKEGINIPEYIKSSDGKKASYIFPIYEVALYLSNTIKVA